VKVTFPSWAAKGNCNRQVPYSEREESIIIPLYLILFSLRVSIRLLLLLICVIVGCCWVPFSTIVRVRLLAAYRKCWTCCTKWKWIVQSLLVLSYCSVGWLATKQNKKKKIFKTHKKEIIRKHEQKSWTKNVEKPTKRCKTLENPIKKGKISVKDLKNKIKL